MYWHFLVSDEIVNSVPEVNHQPRYINCNKFHIKYLRMKRSSNSLIWSSVFIFVFISYMNYRYYIIYNIFTSNKVYLAFPLLLYCGWATPEDSYLANLKYRSFASKATREMFQYKSALNWSIQGWGCVADSYVGGWCGSNGALFEWPYT